MEPEQLIRPNARAWRLLIVEDDQDLREVLSGTFIQSYEVFSADSLEAASYLVEKVQPHIVLLDLHLQGQESFALLEKIRRQSNLKNTQVIVLAEQQNFASKLQCFEQGADDLMEKPFHVDELKARVGACLRRSRLAQEDLKLNCGNAVIDLDRRRVAVAGEQIHLSKMEFDLLCHFVRNPERILPREEIIEVVWHGAAVSHRTVDTHLVALRRKLGKLDHQFVTVYGSGYLFSANPQDILSRLSL